MADKSSLQIMGLVFAALTASTVVVAMFVVYKAVVSDQQVANPPAVFAQIASQPRAN